MSPEPTERLRESVERSRRARARSRRVVSLPTQIVGMLRAHRVRQLEERLRAGPAWEGGEWDLVFTTVFGKPFHGTVVTKRFQALLKRAGCLARGFTTSDIAQRHLCSLRVLICALSWKCLATAPLP